jgi:mannitol-1-phosphate 5-dehydrogenase
MPATFVGFGFGPIQTGLLLFEAVGSGGFDRFVVAEVDQPLVDAVRAAGNEISVNIAGNDGIRTKRLGSIELYNPRVPSDQEAVLSAIADAGELGTAIPSVDLYSAGGDASVASLLARGARPGRQRIVYTAENNNYAAEILSDSIGQGAADTPRDNLQCLNTVVGKMSGVVSSAEEMKRLGLAPLVPGFGKCVLVEEFNRILISRITLPGFVRKIRVFEEKDDLLPFEEAKLYGHNAVHALLGSLARLRGYEVMSSIRSDEKLMGLGRRVFLEEAGAALISRHAGAAETLFTPAGWAAYADDLLQRMVNPWLFDRVERIIRDPARKLGWDDRFFGTMRLCLQAGISPRGLALGAAAAAELAMAQETSHDGSLRALLCRTWGAKVEERAREACIRLVEQAVPGLEEWRT